jgi:hypothetical protein
MRTIHAMVDEWLVVATDAAAAQRAIRHGFAERCHGSRVLLLSDLHAEAVEDAFRFGFRLGSLSEVQAPAS